MAAEIAQPVMMLAAAAAFTASFALGLRRIRADAACDRAAGREPTALSNRPCTPGMSCFVAFMTGITIALALLVWRLAQNHGLRFDNDLDVFLILGLSVAAIAGFFRVTRHLLGLILFLIPMIAALLALGGILTVAIPGHNYHYRTPLSIVHVLTIVGASVCLAAACVGGIVYLLGDRQLKRRGPAAGARWLSLPPLASVEKFNQHAVLLGFPFLTAAIVTGVIRAIDTHGQTTTWALHSKSLISLFVWLGYTPLLHVKLLPAFRGRRAAWLSVIAFGLLISTFVVSNFIGPAR